MCDRTGNGDPDPGNFAEGANSVLCSVLLRGTGLDWTNKGDVWAKVAELRPAEPSITALPLERAHVLAQAMRRLMTVDARAHCTPASGALTGHDR